MQVGLAKGKYLPTDLAWTAGNLAWHPLGDVLEAVLAKDGYVGDGKVSRKLGESNKPPSTPICEWCPQCESLNSVACPNPPLGHRNAKLCPDCGAIWEKSSILIRVLTTIVLLAGGSLVLLAVFFGGAAVAYGVEAKGPLAMLISVCSFLTAGLCLLAVPLGAGAVLFLMYRCWRTPYNVIGGTIHRAASRNGFPFRQGA